MMELVTDVSQAYYDLLFRQADLRSQRRSLALADRLLSDNQQRQEIGRMSRLDVTQAQSEAANRRRQVIQAERALWEAANELKRLIYRDLQNRHGQLMDAPFTPAPPTFEDPVLNARNALENRPDLREQWAAIEQAGIRLAVSRNNLLPTLNLEASYDLLGRDSGFAAGLRDAQENENNEWTVGVTLSIPLGQSAERAARDRARFQQSQALLRLKALEQDILREVDNAVLAVKSNRLSYEAARESTELARDTLEAEIERLNAGTTTTFVVSQLQRDLAVARTTELQALADWYKSLAELSRVEGTALSANGIVMQSWPERPAEIETSEPEFLDATRR
jgi:outer membrane protein TolC